LNPAVPKNRDNQVDVGDIVAVATYAFAPINSADCAGRNFGALARDGNVSILNSLANPIISVGEVLIDSLIWATR
jgi:hypothetical protein